MIENPIEIIAQIDGHIFLDNTKEKNNEIIGHFTIEKTGEVYKDLFCSIKTNDESWYKDIPCYLNYERGVFREDCIIGHLVYEQGNIGEKVIDEDIVVKDNTDTTLVETLDSDTGIYIKNTEILGKLMYMSSIEDQYKRDNYSDGYEILGYVDLIGEKSVIDFASRIKVEEFTKEENKDYHYRYNLPCHLVLEGNYINDIIGKVVISENDVVTKDTTIECNILGKIDGIERDIDITIEDGSYQCDIYGHFNIADKNTEKVEIQGSIESIEKETISELLGHVYLYDTESIEMISRINVVDEIHSYDNEILGHLMIQNDYTKLVCKGYLVLEPTGYVDGNYYYEKDNQIYYHTNEMQSHLIIENNVVENEIAGHLRIAEYYKALEFTCKIRTDKKEYVHSIFSRLIVPPSRTTSFPCRIVVMNDNRLEYDILGKINDIEVEKMNIDILDGHVIYEEGICKDIMGRLNIDSTHTRKEFNCSIEVKTIEEITFPCSIEVGIPKVDTVEERPLISTGYYPSYELENVFDYNKNRIHIEVEDNKVIENNKTTKEESIKLPKGKVAIVVSPRWHYEPMVFKNSLITFLDRYYRKMDLHIVFGGSPRSDFDVINLSLNYKINPSKLLQVPIDIDFRNPYVAQESMDRFIIAMKEFKKDIPIVRVFLFMNHPNWYYNDPLARLANYCKDNNISCVGISDGGEWQEILEVDKVIDQMINNNEYDRQLSKWRPVKGYINIKLPIREDDRIVY